MSTLLHAFLASLGWHAGAWAFRALGTLAAVGVVGYVVTAPVRAVGRRMRRRAGGSR